MKNKIQTGFFTKGKNSSGILVVSSFQLNSRGNPKQ